MPQTHLLSSCLVETPTFENVYLTAQASIQMRVVFETIVCAAQNLLFFNVFFAAMARELRGFLCWSTIHTKNETPKSEISASVGLRKRSVS